MKIVFMSETKSGAVRPADLAEPVDVVEGVARVVLEHVGVFAGLQLHESFADLGEGHGTAEIDSIDGGKDNGGDEEQEKFPHCRGHSSFQECHALLHSDWLLIIEPRSAAAP